MCRSMRSRPTCSMRSSPSKIAASTRIPASIRLGSAARMVRDMHSGARAEGGSTLTQQLARTLFLSNVRPFARKAKEASIALLLEVAALEGPDPRALSESRVPERGRLRRRCDVAASVPQTGRSTLTLSEAALVAGLIRAPSALSPWTNYEGALQRSRIVLAAMREQGFINAEEERAGARGTTAHPTVPIATRSAGGLGQGLASATVPQSVRRRSSARLAGADLVPAGACRTPPSRPWLPASEAPAASRRSRRPWSRSTR